MSNFFKTSASFAMASNFLTVASSKNNLLVPEFFNFKYWLTNLLTNYKNLANECLG